MKFVNCFFGVLFFVLGLNCVANRDFISVFASGLFEQFVCWLVFPVICFGLGLFCFCNAFDDGDGDGVEYC